MASVDCWEIPQDGDAGYNPQAKSWFVWAYPLAVDRRNTALEDFFAQPTPPPVRVVENLRHNPDLDAVFG